MQYFTIYLFGCYCRNNPRNFSCSNPCWASFQFSRTIESINFLLNFIYTQHIRHWLCISLYM